MPDKVTRFLGGLFIHNKSAKLASLLLACASWYMIREVISFEKEVTEVPLEILVDEGWAILDRSEQSAIVTFRGSEDAIWNLDRKQVKVEVDIRGEPMRDAMFIELDPKQVQAPREVRPIQIEPDRLYISLDQEGQREIPVEPSITGQLPEGYELADTICTPSSVILYGPRKRLDEIDSVRTVPIDLAGRIQSFKLREQIVPPGETWVGRVDPENVVIDVSIIEESSSRSFEEVPILVMGEANAEDRLEMTPTVVTVVLKGRPKRLDTLTPQSVRAYVDGADENAGGTNPVPVRVHAPEGVVVKEVLPATVTIERKALEG